MLPALTHWLPRPVDNKVQEWGDHVARVGHLPDTSFSDLQSYLLVDGATEQIHLLCLEILSVDNRCPLDEWC